MSRDTRLKRTVQRALERQLEKMAKKTKPEGRSLAKRIWGYFLFLATVLGAVVTWLALAPRISIVPQTPLISLNAFTAPFIVSNDGYLSLHRVNAICSPKDVTYTEPGHPKHKMTFHQQGPDDDETGGLLNPKLEVRKLRRDHKATFPCDLIALRYAEWVTSAHILLIVRYRPLPYIYRYRRQRFELTREDSGVYRWLEESSPEN